MTTKQVQKKWENQSSKRWNEKRNNPNAFDDPFIQGIADYKASLREAIEKELTTAPSKEAEHYNKGLVKALELLDTVSPTGTK